MESFLSRYKNVLVLVAVLLVQVLVLATQVRRAERGASTESKKVILLRYWANGATLPFERAFLFTGHGIRNGWSGYVDFRRVRRQNQDLLAEVSRLRLEQAGLAEDARQGQRLQALLAFKEKYVYRTVAAQVIGTGGSDQSRVLYLDKGSEDGVHPDMPVITPDGIVGKVRVAFPHSAQVLEINDTTSGAGAILEATRVRGVLRGSAASPFPVIYLLPDERIKTGEQVLTSGGDQVYPRGLVVGRVLQVKHDPEHDPYVEIVVQPAADLSRLEEVLVVTGTTSELLGATQQDVRESESLAGAKKAADVVAERLPGLADPDAAKAAAAASQPGQKPGSGADNANGAIAPARALPALHPDHYTPGETPSADQLTPGAQNPATGSAATGSVGPGGQPAGEKTVGAGSSATSGKPAQHRPPAGAPPKNDKRPQPQP